LIILPVIVTCNLELSLIHVMVIDHVNQAACKGWANYLVPL
jgi:hypothetical protein